MFLSRSRGKAELLRLGYRSWRGFRSRLARRDHPLTALSLYSPVGLDLKLVKWALERDPHLNLVTRSDENRPRRVPALDRLRGPGSFRCSPIGLYSERVYTVRG